MEFSPVVKVPSKNGKDVSKCVGRVSKPNPQSTTSKKANMIGEVDTSSDFSGGCTPYKHVARNAASKLKLGNQKKKLGKYRKFKSDVGDTKDEQHNKHSSQYEDGDVIGYEEAGGTKICNICGQIVTSVMYNGHLKACLKKHFHRSAKLFQKGEAHFVFCFILFQCCL